ncbi:hypothetical protein EDB86DRAFT_2806845 [Lactarius hatsudake]|nr:hypothetical protein EDB86DRAFT_2806845 [Lactarius hatsudake]
MFKVAVDILPVQVSSVPCERIFSSNKETCALRRNILSSALLEILQVLKHVYEQGRFDFTSGLLVATEDDYSIESAAVQRQRLMSSFLLGKKDELLDLSRSMELIIVPRLLLVYTILSSSTRHSAQGRWAEGAWEPS